MAISRREHGDAMQNTSKNLQGHSNSGLRSDQWKPRGRGNAAGVLGNHGRIQGRAVQNPLDAAAGAGKSAHEPPSLEPENKAKAEQTGASPEIRI